MTEVFPGNPEEPLSGDAEANEAIRRIVESDEFRRRATQEPAPDSLILGRDPDGKKWESIGPDGARLYEGDSEDPGDNGGVLV